jgi:hypothetical protein
MNEEILKHISDTLDEVLRIMKTPENKFIRIFEIGSAIVTIVGIISIVDIIITWIGGK